MTMVTPVPVTLFLNNFLSRTRYLLHQRLLHRYLLLSTLVSTVLGIL